MNFENITLERLESDLKALKYHSENDSYLQTYPEFIRYFKSIPHGQISEHHLVIASHFVYGWMPTIIHLGTEKLEETLFYFRAAHAGTLLNEEELHKLKWVINNSMVGLSKLLHFMNPQTYAIWDSRIFRYATGKKTSYGIDQPANYLTYLNRLQELKDHPEYMGLHRQIEDHYGQELTPMRAMELVMFESDKQFGRVYV